MDFVPSISSSLRLKTSQNSSALFAKCPFSVTPVSTHSPSLSGKVLKSVFSVIHSAIGFMAVIGGLGGAVEAEHANAAGNFECRSDGPKRPYDSRFRRARIGECISRPPRSRAVHVKFRSFHLRFEGAEERKRGELKNNGLRKEKLDRNRAVPMSID